MDRIRRRVILLSSFRRVVSGLLVSYSWIVFDGGQITFLHLDFPDRASFVLPWMDDGTVYRCLPCHGCIDTVEAQGVVALVASGGDV